IPDATGSTREAGSGAAQGSAAGRGVKAASTRGAGLRLARLSTLSTVAPTTRGLSNPFMVQGPSVIVTSKTAQDPAEAHADQRNLCRVDVGPRPQEVDHGRDDRLPIRAEG